MKVETDTVMVFWIEIQEEKIIGSRIILERNLLNEISLRAEISEQSERLWTERKPDAISIEIAWFELP